METWIRVNTKEQLDAVRESQVSYQHLILDAALAKEAKTPAGDGVRVYLQLPDVLRQKQKETIETMLDQASSFDGVVVKNLDELGLLLKRKEQLPVIADAFLYAYNRDAICFYRELVPDMKFICSEELTDKEAASLMDDPKAFLYKIYGYQPVMITAQCFRKNDKACDSAHGRTELRDESGNTLHAVADCDLCHTVLYNSVPTSMLDKDTSAYENILYDLTIESAEEVKEILQSRQCKSYTRGHHLSPVD